MNLQTIADSRKYLVSGLLNIYPPEESEAICTIIIKTITGVNRLQQYTNPSLNLTAGQTETLLRMAEELFRGKPVQYVTGETEFAGCLIKVDENTLIPRPETEEMVELIIKEIQNDFNGIITEFATGSGCISIALAKRFPQALVYGSDISLKALEKARKNAEINRVKVNFNEFDMLGDKMWGIKSDLIVCNPPYVTESEKTLMHKNVLDFEPYSALFVPDDNPLIFYKHLSKIGSAWLKRDGTIWAEINSAFGKECSDVFIEAGFKNTKVLKDLSGKERYIKARYHD